MQYMTFGEIKNIHCKYYMKILHFMVDKIQNIWCSVKFEKQKLLLYSTL